MKPDESLPCLILLHGGGWAAPTDCLISYEYFGRLLCNVTSCKVVLVDYRLAPEHKFPVPLHDCYDSVKWIHENSKSLGMDDKRIGIFGISSGANLALGVNLMRRDRKDSTLALQILSSGLYDANLEPYESCKKFGNKYFGMTTDMVNLLWRVYLNETDVKNVYACPLLAEDFHGVPKSILYYTEFDPLRDQNVLLEEKLKKANVLESSSMLTGCEHGVELNFQILKGRNLWLDLGKSVRKLFGVTDPLDETNFQKMEEHRKKFSAEVDKNNLTKMEEKYKFEKTSISIPVSITSLYIAAERCLESEREDRIINEA